MILKPMLATSASELPQGKEWTYEVKWDGCRALAIKEALQHRRTTADTLVYYAFDLLEIDGESLLRRPLDQRRGRLKGLPRGYEGVEVDQAAGRG